MAAGDQVTGGSAASVDLYWLPLGAGGHCVRLNGKVYERLAALRERRAPKDLYHSALIISLDGITWTIEMGPVWNVDAPDAAVVCTGAVGARALGRLRAFRYEVRCWCGGFIPDIDEAVGGARRLTDDASRAAATLRAVRLAPPLTWGRDEAGTGDMWNSNSVIAWTLASGGHDMSVIGPPTGGRAPGWDAGLVLAARRRALRWNDEPRRAASSPGADQGALPRRSRRGRRHVARGGLAGRRHQLLR